MQHILALRHSSLLSQHSVALSYSMIWCFTILGLLADRQHAGPGFILLRHLQDYIIYNDNLLDGQPLDLDIGHLPFVFSLQGG